jgi:hypothetical protein
MLNRTKEYRCNRREECRSIGCPHYREHDKGRMCVVLDCPLVSGACYCVEVKDVDKVEGNEN